MRRILTTALASSLLALALPAAASAHHEGRHDFEHRAEAHHRHHHHHHRHHARTVVFAKRSTTTTTSSGTPAPPTEAVATVASFENGVLKIMLADGSTVSGKVNEMTEISCDRADHDFGDDDDDDDGGSQSGPGSFHHDDERGPQDGQSQGVCGVSALVAGAKVEEAELRVSGAGAFWEKVELFPTA